MKDRLWAIWGDLLIVHTEDPEQRRRGQFLSILILGILAAVGLRALVNTVLLIVSPSPQVTFFVISDILTALVFVGLLYLNRTGKTILASNGFLLILVIAF